MTRPSNKINFGMIVSCRFKRPGNEVLSLALAVVDVKSNWNSAVNRKVRGAHIDPMMPCLIVAAFRPVDCWVIRAVIDMVHGGLMAQQIVCRCRQFILIRSAYRDDSSLKSQSFP